MSEGRRDDKIRSILFACNMNSVRSPMAEMLARHLLSDRIEIESCGVYEGIHDPFTAEVLEEIEVRKPSRPSQSFGQIKPERFDLVVALTPEAAAEARGLGATVEFWDTPNPTETRGSREDLLLAYREVRDALKAKIEARFG